MPWDLGKLSIPRKTSGELMEASYHNFVMQTLEKFINSLIDAYTQFELVAIQKVNGLRLEYEDTNGDLQEKFIVKLSEEDFSSTTDEEFITIKNGRNDRLWTNEKYEINTFVEAINKMKEDYDAKILAITENDDVTEQLKANILEKLAQDLSSAITDLFINLVNQTEFEFELDLA